MDFQEYELLIDLAETGNITKTAERLGYTQPGASHIIKRIEKDTGFMVVNREKYGVKLTKEAELLLPIMREIMSSREKLDQMIHQIKGLEYGHMTIGAYSSVAIHILPKILSEFKELHPNIMIHIREGGADNILKWIDSNEIDFAFISRPYAGSLEFMPYGQDPLVAVVPSGYLLNKDESFPIERFDGQPFIISAEGNDFDIHNALEVTGVKPSIAYSVLDDQTIMSMVENRLGLSILTKLICRGGHYDIELAPLEPEFYRVMGIAMKEYNNLSPAAKKFVDYAISRIPDVWDEILAKMY